MRSSGKAREHESAAPTYPSVAFLTPCFAAKSLHLESATRSLVELAELGTKTDRPSEPYTTSVAIIVHQAVSLFSLDLGKSLEADARRWLHSRNSPSHPPAAEPSVVEAWKDRLPLPSISASVISKLNELDAEPLRDALHGLQVRSESLLKSSLFLASKAHTYALSPRSLPCRGSGHTSPASYCRSLPLRQLRRGRTRTLAPGPQRRPFLTSGSRRLMRRSSGSSGRGEGVPKQRRRSACITWSADARHSHEPRVEQYLELDSLASLLAPDINSHPENENET